MKKIFLAGLVLLHSINLVFSNNKLNWKNDTTNYIAIQAKIVDSSTEEPIVFATVYLSETNIATVSNIEGEFILKIPKDNPECKLTVTHIGYEKFESLASDIQKTGLIKLKAVVLPIDAVVVRSQDPLDLIQAAISNIPDNYNLSPEMQTAFYRETIKQNNRYVSVSEAVMDIYKAGYRTSFDYDRLRIFKGRKSRDLKKMDTILVKLQGGPRTSLMLDIVKYPAELIGEESFEYYEYKLKGVTTINNRETYVISFDQKAGIDYPLYSGSIYIDVESLAFAGFNFQLSERGLPHASKFLVKKKPIGMNVDVLSGHYLVQYRFDNEIWFINHVRSELKFDSKWKKRLFRSKFDIMMEMAVTDRTNENVVKISGKESARLTDIFSEEVEHFEDENFWGEHNTIKPDESIEAAIEKLNKKLKRRRD